MSSDFKEKKIVIIKNKLKADSRKFLFLFFVLRCKKGLENLSEIALFPCFPSQAKVFKRLEEVSERTECFWGLL